MANISVPSFGAARRVASTPWAFALYFALIATGCARKPDAQAKKRPPATPGASLGGSTVPGAGRPGPVIDGLGPEVLSNCSTVGSVDVNVVVTTAHGPLQVDGNGKPMLAAAPIAVTNAAYSQGIYDPDTSDYDLNDKNYDATKGARFDAYLRALKPGMLRYPAGYLGQEYLFKRSNTPQAGVLTTYGIDTFVALCRRVGAAPYIAVNIESAGATPAMAADVVRYVNKEKNYGVVYWQIGNEPDLPGKSWTPQSYATAVNQFETAMLAVDPTIKFVAPVLLSGMHILGKADGSEMDWLTPMLAAMQAGGGRFDVIDWHYYPLYSGDANPNSNPSSSANIRNLLQEDASDWPPAGLDFADTIMPHLARLKTQYPAQLPNAQVWIDEFAEDPGNHLAGAGLGDVSAGALWAGDAVGRYLDYGVGAMFKFIFKAPAQYKYTMLDANFEIRPEYYAYWLYAQHFGDRMVAAQIDQRSKVGAHAAVRTADGSLRVILVNKQDIAQRVRLTLADYKPRAAGQYQYSAASITAQTATVNGQALSMANIGLANQAIPAANADACADNILTLPPSSLVMVIFAK